jgi:hypothetical protein
MKLTYQDLVELRSKAIEAFKSVHARIEVEGAPAAGLAESDIQALAWLDAAARFLEGRKLMGPLGREGIVPSVWEE